MLPGMTMSVNRRSNAVPALTRSSASAAFDADDHRVAEAFEPDRHEVPHEVVVLDAQDGLGAAAQLFIVLTALPAADGPMSAFGR